MTRGLLGRGQTARRSAGPRGGRVSPQACAHAHGHAQLALFIECHPPRVSPPQQAGPASWVGSSAYCRQGCVSGASHGSDPLNVRYPSIFSPNQPSFLTFGTTPSEQHQSPRPTPIQLFINAFLLLSPDSPPTRRADSHGIPYTHTSHASVAHTSLHTAWTTMFRVKTQGAARARSERAQPPSYM